PRRLAQLSSKGPSGTESLNGTSRPSGVRALPWPPTETTHAAASRSEPDGSFFGRGSTLGSCFGSGPPRGSGTVGGLASSLRGGFDSFPDGPCLMPAGSVDLAFSFGFCTTSGWVGSFLPPALSAITTPSSNATPHTPPAISQGTLDFAGTSSAGAFSAFRAGADRDAGTSSSNS